MAGRRWPCPSCRSRPIRRCSDPARTGWSTSPRTCRPRTSSPPRPRGSTRSSWSSGSRPRRWARRRGSSRPSTLVAVLAEATGRTIEGTGTTVWRPPYAPITLGALAGRGFEPVRYSPCSPGTRPIGAGPSSPATGSGRTTTAILPPRSATCGPTSGSSTSRRSASSTCAAPTSPNCSTSSMSTSGRKLAVGGVRYGVMCAEDGVVLDDGVTGRLGAEHYLMSTTSSGAATVWEWVENWLQTEHPEWHIHVTPVTTALRVDERRRSGQPEAAPAAGRRRRPLPRLVPVHARPPRDRGRSRRLLHVAHRLHRRAQLRAACPRRPTGSTCGRRCLEAGADLGIRPFGVEAQRIMRLEKGHFIVGQDTDGLTQAFAAGLDWLIKLDKQDFAGRPELVWQHERRRLPPARRPPTGRSRMRPAGGVPDHRARPTGGHASSAGSRRAGCHRR